MDTKAFVLLETMLRIMQRAILIFLLAKVKESVERQGFFGMVRIKLIMVRVGLVIQGVIMAEEHPEMPVVVEIPIMPEAVVAQVMDLAE